MKVGTVKRQGEREWRSERASERERDRGMLLLSTLSPMSKLKSTNRFARDAPGANLLSRASRGSLIGTRSGFSRTGSVRLREINARQRAWTRSESLHALDVNVTIPSNYLQRLGCSVRILSRSLEVNRRGFRLAAKPSPLHLNCANFYNMLITMPAWYWLLMLVVAAYVTINETFERNSPLSETLMKFLCKQCNFLLTICNQFIHSIHLKNV